MVDESGVFFGFILGKTMLKGSVVGSCMTWDSLFLVGVTFMVIGRFECRTLIISL
jgi:hypothetical protein